MSGSVIYQGFKSSPHFIIKISSKEMHHPTSFNWRLTDNRFYAKSDSAFERAKLQLLFDGMPFRFSLIFVLRAATVPQATYDFAHVDHS
jgi:hypothetical protein